jgi:hypothetical protein
MPRSMGPPVTMMAGTSAEAAGKVVELILKAQHRWNSVLEGYLT